MPTACEIDADVSIIFGALRYSPIFTLALYFFAFYLLFYQSSGHSKVCRRQYTCYLVAKVCGSMLLGSGMSPILRLPALGYQTMGFLQMLNMVNMAWPIILTIFAHIMIVLTLLLLIDERCLIIQNYCDSQREKYQIKMAMIQNVKYLVITFIMLSSWALLVLSQFDQEQAALKESFSKPPKGIECPIFFLMDSQSWRIMLVTASLVCLCFLFVLYATLKIKTTFEMFQSCQMRLSRKIWRVQQGFLILKIAHVGAFVIFVMLMSVILYAVSSNFATYFLLFLISQHGTVSILIFIFTHKFVRSFMIQNFNSCMPKPYRIGSVVDVSENLEQPQIQVFAVIQPNSTF